MSAAALSGGICWWLKKYQKEEADRFRAHGIYATGTVVRHHTRSVVTDTESQRRADVWFPVVEFRDREGNEVRFVSTLMAYSFDAVPVNALVTVVYLPETPQEAEMVEALGNPSAGQIDGSGQFISSSGGYCGLFFGLFIFLSVICVMAVSMIASL
ncbi:DUF3592 domain-containing protein [Streptomyces buecherae]|uniref:DUF3592 domain-containing protein n=1 Tax=Streptomyces buecherae TaxID=2763006 RepID=A0A7H8NCC4_9ACTN|nr:DUF3592 domain-containing protein [Streptomyces buecherae]QKW52064.1 DUF3592 domain-containing protein [Streptomyces buecherae]